MKTAMIASPAYLHHLTGPYHPERPERVQVIGDALQKENLFTTENYLAPRSCGIDELLLCHTQKYIELVKKESEFCLKDLCPDDGSIAISTGDASICSKSFEVACLAAGGALTAVDAVMSSYFQNAFAIVTGRLDIMPVQIWAWDFVFLITWQ